MAMAMHNMKRIPLINQKAYLIMLFLRLKPMYKILKGGLIP